MAEMSRSKERKQSYLTRLSIAHARAAKGFYLGHPHAKPKQTPRGAGWPPEGKTAVLGRKRQKGFLHSAYPPKVRYS